MKKYRIREDKTVTKEDRASALHDQGCNCAQAVLMAMQEYTGLEETVAASVASGFGGGVKSGELCGAISGAVMAIGMNRGAENRPQTYELDQLLTSAFREKFGAVRCEELKAAGIPCDDLIRFAAGKAEELLSVQPETATPEE